MINSKAQEFYNKTDIINPYDYRKRIINIDSKFRNNIADSPTNFLYKFPHPYKNIVRIRLASIEIPNIFYIFSEKRGNISFKLSAKDYVGTTRVLQVRISEGNYRADELEAEIQKQFDAIASQYGMFFTITIDTINIKTTITFKGTAAITSPPATAPTKIPTPFIIDFRIDGYHDRIYDFGLGYNLGFRNNLYNITVADPSDNYYKITSETIADTVGDTYLLLAVDDLHAVEQRTNNSYVQCFAKIIVREPKGDVIYDDGSTMITNEVVLPAPTDFKQVRIKLMDPYGQILDLLDMNFSFTLEFTEVNSLATHEFYRNYAWEGKVPHALPQARGAQQSAYNLLNQPGTNVRRPPQYT
jgi:hypothetical protein